LRLLENRPGASIDCGRRDPPPQLYQHPLPFPEVGWIHPELLMHRDIGARVDDLQRFVADAITDNRALSELVCDHQPESAMVFIAGGVCDSWFALAEDVGKFVTVERKADYGAYRAAQIHGKISRVKSGSKDAHPTSGFAESIL